jgi:glycosyltransferase involved in cell wall biosynthesis
LAALRKIAGPTISIMGHQPFKVVKEHFEHCKAFLYPQVEDFGITAVEAQAAGKPVIAYRAGGALETVVENKTGLFFDEQTPESLIDAVERFEKMPNQWNKKCRENALRFSPERFRDEIKSFLLKHYANILDEYPWPNCF